MRVTNKRYDVHAYFPTTLRFKMVSYLYYDNFTTDNKLWKKDRFKDRKYDGVKYLRVNIFLIKFNY